MRSVLNFVAGVALLCASQISFAQTQPAADDTTPAASTKTASESVAAATSTEAAPVAESNKETTAQPQSATAESAEATASEAAKSEEPEEQGKPEPIAGYNMIEKDGRWLYCHKVKAAAGTGSRLSPVTECHTADQVAVEQKALKK